MLDWGSDTVHLCRYASLLTKQCAGSELSLSSVKLNRKRNIECTAACHRTLVTSRLLYTPTSSSVITLFFEHTGEEPKRTVNCDHDIFYVLQSPPKYLRSWPIIYLAGVETNDSTGDFVLAEELLSSKQNPQIMAASLATIREGRGFLLNDILLIRC